MIGGIKEIGSVEMRIKFLNSTVDAGRINDDFNRTLLNICAIEVKRQIERVKADMRVRIAEMAIAESDVARLVIPISRSILLFSD